jgi:predicted AlkP superfamily phosphohydrolase/phosphomutase
VSATILLGIDGMDPVVTEELLGNGHLPNFELLAKEGRYNRLATINPPQSPVVWTSISTGISPAGHGVFDFIQRDPASYQPYLSLHHQEKGRFINPIKNETFWEFLARNGKPACLLKWPMSFPPRPFDGRLLAGLGVPDIKGMLGTYSLLTTVPERISPDSKGRITKLVFQSGKAQADIAGPFAASRSGRKEATLPVSIQRQESCATLRIGRQAFQLAPGQWSPWVTLRFDIGFFRNVTAHCRFLLKQITPDFELYITPLQVDYASSAMPISAPAGYAAELRDNIGPYATLGMAEDTAALNDGALNDAEFIALCDSVMEERERMCMHELDRFSNGLLACVFDTTDRIQHMFWRMRDPAHPLHDPGLAERYGDVIGRYYRWMDRILGVVREKQPHARLLICSDHGFGGYRHSVHLNNWLEQNGYLTRKTAPAAATTMADTYDWSLTKAYAVGFNGLYLNLKGRERDGCVPSEETPRIIAELRQRLAGLLCNGDGAIRAVHGGGGRNGPDMVIGFNDGFRASWQTAVGGITGGTVIEENRKKWSGDHCCDAELTPGVFFSSALQAEATSVMDLFGLITDGFSREV